MGVGGVRVGVDARLGGSGVCVRRVGVGVRHSGNFRFGVCNPHALCPLVLVMVLLLPTFGDRSAAHTLLSVANDSRADDDVHSVNREKFVEVDSSVQDRVGDGGVEYEYFVGTCNRLAL